MNVIAATTKLESVNIMLSAIGESPINTLSETTGSSFDNTVLPVDAQMALDILQEQNFLILILFIKKQWIQFKKNFIY